MRTAIILFIPILLIVINTEQANAQPAGVKVGDKIKIDAPLYLDKRVIGNVVDINAYDISILNNDRYLHIPHSGIKNLSVSKGTKRNPGRGLLIGAGIVGVMGGTYEAFSYKKCVSTGWFSCMMAPTSRSEAFFRGAYGGAVLGGVTGFFVGLFTKTDIWSQQVSKFPSAITHQYNNQLHRAPVLTLKYLI